jgi:hypothetical protein
MEKKVKIEVHAPHVKQDSNLFLVVRVEGSHKPRVGTKIVSTDLEKMCDDPQFVITQTGVWGSPRRI